VPFIAPVVFPIGHGSQNRTHEKPLGQLPVLPDPSPCVASGAVDRPLSPLAALQQNERDDLIEINAVKLVGRRRDQGQTGGQNEREANTNVLTFPF
jgi:hypothetical protein